MVCLGNEPRSFYWFWDCTHNIRNVNELSIVTKQIWVTSDSFKIFRSHSLKWRSLMQIEEEGRRGWGTAEEGKKMKGGKVRSPGEKAKESETEEGRIRKKNAHSFVMNTNKIHNGLQSYCY